MRWFLAALFMMIGCLIATFDVLLQEAAFGTGPAHVEDVE